MLLFVTLLVVLVAMPLAVEAVMRPGDTLISRLRFDIASYAQARRLWLQRYAQSATDRPTWQRLAEIVKHASVAIAIGAYTFVAADAHREGALFTFTPSALIITIFAVAAGWKGTPREAAAACSAAALYYVVSGFRLLGADFEMWIRFALAAGFGVAAVIGWVAGRRVEKSDKAEKAG